MRDTLPRRPHQIESLVLNHDESKNQGSHWTAMVKIANNAYYFDSYGNLPPPFELINYLGAKTRLKYNYHNYQKFNTIVCGQLCLKFLYDFWMKFRINTLT